MTNLRVENQHADVLPHLRGKDYQGPSTKPIARSGNPSTPKAPASASSSDSNPYSGNGTESVWKAVGRARNPPPIPFNGMFTQ